MSRRARLGAAPRARQRVMPALAAVAVVGLVAVHAVTAANVVPPSRASYTSHPVTANQLAPAECAALDLVNVYTGGASGGTGNDLVLGTAGPDDLKGGPGDDCLVGGDGDDRLNGQAGYDICLGQGGNDFHRPQCEESDGV